MKTADKPREIKPLLDALEHHGRDLRRQQQLAAMIDSMAATDTKEYGGKWKAVRIWSLRVAAAACALFFIATAVRVWYIPTKEPGVTVASNMPAYHQPAADETPESQPTAGEAPAYQKPTASRVHTYHVEHITYTTAMPEAEPDAWAEPEMLPTPEIPIEELLAEELASPQTEPVAEPKAEEPRQSIWRSLFHRSEPSRMDGTMLAINLL